MSDILHYAISGAVRHPEYSPDTQGRMIEGAHVLVHGLRRLSDLRDASPAALTLRSVILEIRITGLDEMVRPRSDIQRLSQFAISNDDRDLVEAYLKPTGGLKERLAAAEMTAPFGNGDDIVEAYLNPTEGLGVHLTAAEMTTAFGLGDGLGSRSAEEMTNINSGWDWSHVRDSSPAAIRAMAEYLRSLGCTMTGRRRIDTSP